jgi:Tol biopolymer transport system component
VSDRDLSLHGFCRLPSGRIVYSRQESWDSNDDNLWQLGIDSDAGTPTGEPKRITQWAGSNLWGLRASADGKRLTLQKATYQEQVYVGELTAGGTRMSPPRRLTNDEASDEPYAWMPDSKAVLFSSDRNGTWGIFKQQISQDTAESVVRSGRLRKSAPQRRWGLDTLPGVSKNSWLFHSASLDADSREPWRASVCDGDPQVGELWVRSRSGEPLRGLRGEPR